MKAAINFGREGLAGDSMRGAGVRDSLSMPRAESRRRIHQTDDDAQRDALRKLAKLQGTTEYDRNVTTEGPRA